MKTLFIILLSLLIMSSSNCKSTVEMSHNKDELNEAQVITIQESGSYYQKWVAGIKGGGSGINLYIPSAESKTIVYKEVYFRSMKTSLSTTKVESKSYYLGRFKTALNSKKDLNMDGNTKGEYGNASPLQNKVDPPFEISESEAIVVYTENDEEKFLKITGIKEKPMIAMPMQRNPNNKN
ncbi:MAG: hypothetical protein HRT68_00460 [Flavobacteriaceae bacterium]|nr:hypothetical protein [Flavobacteriaceae bacterium]